MKTLAKTLPLFAWSFIKPQFWRFALLIFVNFGWSIQEAVYPYFLKLIVDKVSQNTSEKIHIFTVLAPTLTIFAALWLTIEVGYRIYDFLSVRVFPRFRADVRTALFQYAIKHSHQYYSDNFAGSIANKISRLPEALEQVINKIFTLIMPVIVAFIISMAFLYQAKPVFAYIMGGWFTLHCAITYFFTRQCAVYSLDHSASRTALNGKIVDILTNMVNVRLFANRRFEEKYFGKFQQVEAQKSQRLLQYNAWMKLCLGLASQTFSFSMILGGVYAWQQDWISLGELTLILSSLNLIGLAWFMGMHLIDVFENAGTCQEALSIAQKSLGVVDKPAAKPIEIHRGEIRFEDVTFHYSKDKKLFQNKTLVIHPGERVGLVGFSGSGKTTFVNLILRYFDLEGGRILIDDQNIQEVTQDSLREQIALIPQDTSLFHRSLMENIRYGRLGASDAEVIEASKKAHCHEFIQQLDNQYETLVGERGIKLSGGQRQRIAIARAILKNAPLLIRFV